MPYFYNEDTGMSLWEAPKYDRAGNLMLAITAAAEAAPQHRWKRDRVETPLPQGWELCFDDAGSRYYFCVATGESSWDVPIEPPADAKAEPVPDAEEMPAEGPGGLLDNNAWTEEWSGEGWYLFNAASGESKWLEGGFRLAVDGNGRQYLFSAETGVSRFV